MIPQITEINFPSYATLNSATITLSEMGDRNITTQIKIDGDIVPDFSGWELEFKGERFILPVKEPQAAKDNTSRRSIVDLTFSSWAVQEMKRYFFVEMTSIESGTAIADKYKASLGLNIENFVIAFNNVLDYYFAGQIEMDLFGSGTGIYSAEPAFFEIDYTHIWDVLQKIYEIYQVRWTITYDSTTEKYVIKVGYPAAEIDDHEFEYGYEGGLLRFERQVQDYDITNVLLGRGGEKNLPYRYFKKVDPQNPNWAADPDAIPELKNIYFENLRDINFRRYVQGWKTNPNRILEEGDVVEAYDSARGETDFAYAKGHTDERFNPVEYVKDDASIAIYGERWGALENADDIYPTIQGIEVDPYGRIDQVVDVEPVTTDDIEAMAADAAEVTNVAGASRTEWINYNSTLELDINGADFSVPEGKVGNLTIQNTWFDTILYAKRGNDQVNVDPADAVHELVGINTTLSYVTVVNRSTGTELPPSGIPAGNYFYKLHIVVKAEFESSMYNSVNVTVGVNGMKLTTSEGSANAWKPTFDIWVKNIWNTTQQSGESDEQYAARVWEPILGDRTGEEAKVAFSTGFLSISEDYNFTIASIPVVDRTKTIDGVASEWRITLIKSDAEYEATGKYIPNAETGGNASAGDYFFFTGIDMPWAYVLWAEEKLNAYKETELAKLKQINPTWIIRIDKVRANTKEQGELEYLADRFASGAKLKVKDKRFTNGQVLTLYVQTVTYTWQEPSSGNPYLVPDIEVVLSDKIEVSADPVTQLEGDVQNIQSTYAKISDIESAIRRVASPIFLKKTGESERSLSPTRFSSLMASESFRQGDIGGQGWGAYTDGEGHSVLEADTIVVRKDMRVNTLTVNQIAYLGGKQIISAAAMECTKVDDTDSGYVCYFDQKQGSVANLFKADDIVLGQVWNADESEQRYYKRKVIAVGTDSITLSKDIADGDGVPQPKDIMVQYGSYSDTSRQYVIVRDVIGGGYERMLSGLTTVYANGDEYYFAGRQSGSTPRWFVGDANGQHASYQNGVLNITGRLSVTTQVDKGNGTYESLSNYLSNLQDQIDGNIQTWYAAGEPTLQNYPASTWPTVEDKNNHIGDLYYESETGKAYRFMLDGNTYKWVQIADEDIAAALALAQQNQTAIAGLAYLKAATNQGTLVQGGLVLTSMIQLGQTEEGTYKVYSGINGIMDTTALGNGIAAWYGGPMADIGADSTLTDFAKSLFRFDGSGYLASGNIKWDLNGNGEIPGISWNNGRITLSPDIYLQGGDRLTQIVDAVNRMYTQFAYDSHDNIVVKPTDAFYIPTSAPQYPLAGGVALWYDYNGNYSEIPSGGGGGGETLTVTKNGSAWLSYNGSTAVSLNLAVPTTLADLTDDSTHRLVTDTQIAAWNAKYDKPSGGIPASDLADAYLPLTAGSGKALTGDLYFNAASADKNIRWVNNASNTQKAITMHSGGNISIGPEQITAGKNTYIYGTSLYLNFGSSKQIIISGDNIRPSVNNGLSMGSSSLKWNSIYATNLYGSLALSNVTGADDLKAIEALTETSGFLKKTAANTWSLTNDIEASSLKTTTEEDAIFTYRHTPSVAVGDMAKVLCVKGKSIVWNQLVDIIHIQATNTGSYANFPASRFNIISGHKYLVRLSNWNNVTNVRLIEPYVGSTQSSNYIMTATQSGSAYWQYVGPSDASVDFYINIHDLTAMGLDSLTAEQFEALYLLPYYDYNPGEPVSNKTAAIETTGFNQWDEEWEVGSINTTTGANDASTSRIRTKNYISVFPSTTYYFLKPARKLVYLYYYDAEQNFLNYADPFATSDTGGTFTTPTAARYMRFIKATAEYNHDICINLSNPSRNGEYQPYKKDTLELNITDLVPANKPTLRLNQQIGETATSSVTAYGYSVTRNEAHITISNVSATSPTTMNLVIYPNLYQKIVVGHTYYIKTDLYKNYPSLANTNTLRLNFLNGDGLKTLGTIFTSATACTNVYLRIAIAIPLSVLPVGGTMNFFVDLIDLTEMYGAGNEPTNTALIEEQIGTGYIPYNTGEDIPNRIYPKGAKSAGTACDVIRQTDTDRVIGVVDLGTLSWSYSNTRFKATLNRQNGTLNLLCTLYQPTSLSTTAPDKTIYAGSYYGANQIAIYDSAYTDAATFKAAMSGVLLYYEQATPEHFDLLNPLSQLVACDPDGTQRRLPEDTASSVSAPMVCDFQYGVNPSDVNVKVESELSVLNKRLDTFSFADLASHPTTLSGYGITDAVPSSRKVNNKALSSDITLTLDDLADGSTRKLANYLPLAAGSSSALTGTLYSQNILPNGSSYALGSSRNPWSEVRATTFYGNLDWSYIQNKPTYTLDDVADGSTRKLADYLPLSGGTMTGNITFSTSSDKSIYANNGTLNQRVLLMTSSGNLSIGYDLPANSKTLYLDGYSIYLRYGTTKENSILLNGSNGTISRLKNMVSATTETYNLGNTGNRWLGVYANTVNAAKGFTTAGTLSVTGVSTFTGNLVPNTTNATDIGSSSKKFKNLYLAGTATVNGISSSGNILPSSTGLSLGSSSNKWAALWTDDLGVNGAVLTSLIPDDGVFDLGASGAEWGSLYVGSIFASGEIRLSANNGKVVVEGLGGLFHYNDDEGDDFGLVYLGRQNGVEKIFVGNDDEYLDIVLNGHTYAFEADVANSLAIPKVAPSNPDANKAYLWVNPTGNYAELPNS